MPPVCEGITVVDFGSGFAPSVASMILADNGAEVIEIEPPAATPSARCPPGACGTAARKASP